jgi:hypothetical protein
MGSGAGLEMLSFSNSILLVHTFPKKSSKTWIVSCSPGQRRSETEGRKASIVADGQRLAVDVAIDGAEATIVQHGFSAIADIECRSVEGAFGTANLFTLRNLFANSRFSHLSIVA